MTETYYLPREAPKVTQPEPRCLYCFRPIEKGTWRASIQTAFGAVEAHTHCHVARFAGIRSRTCAKCGGPKMSGPEVCTACDSQLCSTCCRAQRPPPEPVEEGPRPKPPTTIAEAVGPNNALLGRLRR